MTSPEKSDADDLITWLRAQLDEDELWAKAASSPSSSRPSMEPVPGGVHWVWGLGGNWEHYEPDPLEEYFGENWDGDERTITLITREEFDTHSVGPLAHSVLSYVEEVRTVDAAHIARHDPARVLAEVDAKRRTLNLHPLRSDGRICNEDEDIYPCETVRLLALPYADRPGYRQEWRPS